MKDIDSQVAEALEERNHTKVPTRLPSSPFFSFSLIPFPLLPPSSLSSTLRRIINMRAPFLSQADHLLGFRKVLRDISMHKLDRATAETLEVRPTWR